VARILNEKAREDAVFTCDVGTPTIWWAARYLTMNGRRRLLGSFNHGSIANALPQAIGAQSALSGDGGLAMLLGDLLTLRQLNLPVKVVVFKNKALGFVELEMKASGFLDYATELHSPDFAKLAESAGVRGLRADSPEQVGPAIAEALAYDGPALVEAVVARQELAMPPSIGIEQARGFTLFMVKAILNGRGDEIVELAKTNLLR
jgi:pyruvate dehydrogenase (quinone)